MDFKVYADKCDFCNNIQHMSDAMWNIAYRARVDAMGLMLVPVDGIDLPFDHMLYQAPHPMLAYDGENCEPFLGSWDPSWLIPKEDVDAHRVPFSEPVYTLRWQKLSAGDRQRNVLAVDWKDLKRGPTRAP